MHVFHLPNDVVPHYQDKQDAILFHHYTAPMGSFKGKSILHKNAISLVVTGQKTMHFADQSVHISPDEFHFLSMGNCLVTMDLDESQTFSSLLIFFDTAILADFHRKYDKKIALLRKQKNIPAQAYIGIKKDAFIWHFMDSLQLLLRSAQPISMEMKQLKLEELFLYLLEHHPHQLLSFPLYKNPELGDLEIRRAVENNITTRVSVEELAFICNLSLSTFKRRFTRIYGTSPSRWILQQRMELARHLLEQRHEKPSEVFYKVGYENHSSFSETFKQQYGVTPKQYQLRQMTVLP